MHRADWHHTEKIAYCDLYAAALDMIMRGEPEDKIQLKLLNGLLKTSSRVVVAVTLQIGKDLTLRNFKTIQA